HTRFSRDWSSDVCSSDLILTMSQDTSSSSATILASAVPICCPISAYLMLTVTVPSAAMEYHRVGVYPSREVPIAASATPVPRPRSEERRVGKEASAWVSG